MNNNLYGHVGRPTNEEVNKKKQKKQLKIILILISVIFFVCLVFVIKNYKKIEFSSLEGNSATQQSVSNRISNNYIYHLYTGSNSSNALQGSAGYDNFIFFGTTASGSDKKTDYKSTIYYYDIVNKNLYKQWEINDEINSNYKSFKNNDITLNTKQNKIYYLYYDAGHSVKDTNILMRTGNRPDVYNTKEYNFYNLGYSKSLDKYISVSKNYIYFYDLIDNQIKVSSMCRFDNSLKNTDDRQVVLQGITVTGKKLFVANQIVKKDSNNKTVYYTNNINFYDLRNCFVKNRMKIKLSKQYNLGYDNKKYELESLFFMNNKLYLGYNARDFRNIYFYTFNIANTSNINLSVNNDGDDKYLIGNISNNNNVILAYSFCKSKNYKDCKFKSFGIKNGAYNVKDSDFSISQKVTDTGTYYLHVNDNFGKVITSNAIVVE